MYSMCLFIMASDEDMSWKTKYYEKCKSADKIVAGLKSLKSVRCEFKAKLKKLEETNQRTFVELYSLKAAIEDKNDTIKKIRANLKSKEEELCDVRGKLDEALSCSKLNSGCTGLADAESNTEHAKGERLPEREVQCNKLKAVCERLSETSNALSVIDDGIRRIKDTVTNVTRKLEEAGNNQEREMGRFGHSK